MQTVSSSDIPDRKHDISQNSDTTSKMVLGNLPYRRRQGRMLSDENQKDAQHQLPYRMDDEP